MRIKLPLWWAWLGDDGVIHIQKYTNDRKIQNIEQLPLCKGIFEPFEAVDYDHAKKKIQIFLDEQTYHQKKNTQ
jgi:hypothetical protein